MKKTGLVYRRESGPFNYQAWPTVTADENGVLYAVWSGNRVNHIDVFAKTYLSKSYDNGETWSLPQIINDSYLDDRDAGICYLGNNKFIISYFSHDINMYLNDWREHSTNPMTPAEKAMSFGAFELYNEVPQKNDEYGSFVRITTDGFITIGEPIKIPISCPHGPILLKSGAIGYIGTDMYANGECEKDALCYYKSDDNGKTFYHVGTIPLPDGYDESERYLFNEPHVVELENGNLFGAFRTHSKGPGPVSTMSFTSSIDGGKTWSKLKVSNISGQPPHLTLLKDGRIILTYSRRVEPNRIEAIISSNNGKTFTSPIIIENFPQHNYAGDFGYPSTVELNDGTLLTVYYAIYDKDKKPSIFYTKWKL